MIQACCASVHEYLHQMLIRVSHLRVRLALSGNIAINIEKDTLCLQGFMVQPGWMDYAMSRSGVLQTLHAFRLGMEDTPLQMTITGNSGPTPLRFLTSIPLQQWPAMVGNYIGQACNARTFSRRPNDFLAQKATQIIGRDLASYARKAHKEAGVFAGMLPAHYMPCQEMMHHCLGSFPFLPSTSCTTTQVVRATRGTEGRTGLGSSS